MTPLVTVEIRRHCINYFAVSAAAVQRRRRQLLPYVCALVDALPQNEDGRARGCASSRHGRAPARLPVHRVCASANPTKRGLRIVVIDRHNDRALAPDDILNLSLGASGYRPISDNEKRTLPPELSPKAPPASSTTARKFSVRRAQSLRFCSPTSTSGFLQPWR